MRIDRPRLAVWPNLYPRDDTQARIMDARRETEAQRLRLAHREAMERYLRGEGDCPEFRRWA